MSPFFKIFSPLALSAGILCPATSSIASTQAFSAEPSASLRTLSVTSAVTSPATSSTSSLTLPVALDRALKANPEIAAAMREVQAQQGVRRQAGMLPNPELAATVEDTQKATRTTTIQLNQLIELGGKRSARMSAAERQYDIAVIELAMKRAEIHAAVVSYFYEVLIAQERQRLARSSTELAQTVTQAASKRVLTGKISPLEETKARVAESAIRIELAQANSDLITARQQLAAVMGSHLSIVETVAAQSSGATSRLTQPNLMSPLNLPNVPSLPEIMASMQRSPILLRARTEVDRRLALSQVERSRRVPDITLSVGAKRDEQLGRNQAIFGVSIPLPLFDRNQGNLQEALSRTDKARDELSATELRLGSELMQAHQRLSVAREETTLMQKDLLPGAQTAYDASLKGFEFGKFSFLDVLDAQRTLLQAQSQYLRTLSDTQRAAAEMVRLTGDATLIAALISDQTASISPF